MKSSRNNFSSFGQLNNLVEKLRKPNGCDWDRAQTANSLIPYFIEEVYELIEGIDKKDSSNIKEELGDVLLHIVFQSQIASEEKSFTIHDVISEINKKLIDRHPNVFDKKNENGNLINEKIWEKKKQINKKRKSRIDGIPKILPSILMAQRIQGKASTVGFDWENIYQVWGKLDEEIVEVKAAQQQEDLNKIEEELGDLLFTVVNLCRFLNVSAENALRKANEKFKKRFYSLEAHVSKSGRKIEDLSLKELNTIWNLVKES